jgi:hypothetical protein
VASDLTPDVGSRRSCATPEPEQSDDSKHTINEDNISSETCIARRPSDARWWKNSTAPTMTVGLNGWPRTGDLRSSAETRQHACGKRLCRRYGAVVRHLEIDDADVDLVLSLFDHHAARKRHVRERGLTQATHRLSAA